MFDGLHQQAVVVGTVTEPRERHREAAFLVGVPPRIGPGDDLWHLIVGHLAVPSNPHRHPGAAGARHGLPHRLHRGSADRVLAGVQDGFVADGERAESGRIVGGRAPRTRPHRRRMPAIPIAQREELGDGVGPGFRISDRVAAGQSDADLHAVGDRGPAVG